MSLPDYATVIRECRVAYPNLVKTAPDLNGVEKYSAVLLIDKASNIDNIKAALKAARENGRSRKWGGTDPANMHIPLQDGDSYAAQAPDKRQHYVGHYYINVKQDPDYGEPVVLDQYGMETKSTSAITGGDYVDAVVEFYPYKGVASSGISASPKIIRKVRDGEPIGGGTSKAAGLAALGIDPDTLKQAPSNTAEEKDDIDSIM